GGDRRARARADARPPNRRERPDHDVLAAREVQERLVAGKRESRRRHRVLLDLGESVLERRRRVMDLGAAYAQPLVQRVEAVALGEEMLRRPGLGGEGLARRPVASQEGERTRRSLAPRARELDAVVDLRRDRRAEVRQLEEPARALDGERAVGVEAEEE